MSGPRSRLLADLRPVVARVPGARRVRSAVVALRGGSVNGSAAAGLPGGQTPAWYVAEWGKLASAVTGRPDAQPGADRVAAHTTILQAERHRGEAVFAE